MKNTFIKFTAVIIAVVFMMDTVAWAVSGSRDVFASPCPVPVNISLREKNDDLKITDIYISEQYGIVEKLRAVGAREQPMVVLIKDAHCNYEAQTNIAKIIEILIRDYGVDLVCIEGAEGKVDTSVFQSFPYKEVRKNTVDKYVKKGLLSGAEALSISEAAELPFSIWGVEDTKLYVEDFKAFRNTLAYRAETEYFIKQLKRIINLLKPHIFSPELVQFDEKLSEYRENKLSLSNWAKYLSNKIKDRTGYPNFELVIKSIELEERIDFRAVESERSALIRELEKSLVKEELETLVKQSLYFKLGKISSLDYYSYLERLISQDTNSYTNLLGYIDLVKLQDRVDSTGLFDELESISDKVAFSYFYNQLDEQLYKLSHDCRILGKLFHLSMSREDLDYYRKNRDRFHPDKLLSFINIQAPLNNIPLPDEFKEPVFLEKIEGFMQPAEKFYQLALKRDNVLVNNLLKQMDNEGKRSAIIVAGGFHSHGIEQKLQDKGISYITVSPKITKIQEDNPYLGIMMNIDVEIDSIPKEAASNISIPLICAKNFHSSFLDDVEIDMAESLFSLLKKFKGRDVSILEIKKEIEKIYRDNPEQLEGISKAFDRLLSLVKEEKAGEVTVKELLGAVSPLNLVEVYSGYTDSDVNNETYAETLLELLNLSCEEFDNDNSITYYLERLRDDCKSSILRDCIETKLKELKQIKPGFMGNYEIIGEPYYEGIGYDKEEGREFGKVIVKARSMKDKKQSTFEFNATRGKIELKEMLEYLGYRCEDSFTERLIRKMKKSLPENVILLSDNMYKFLDDESDEISDIYDYKIFGIGKLKMKGKWINKSTFAIAESLADEPIGLFHEMGEWYFSKYGIKVFKDCLPKEHYERLCASGEINKFAHIFLRGCGKRLRVYYKFWGQELKDAASFGKFKRFCGKEFGYEISEAEKNLIFYNLKEGRENEETLWGLQDRLFGEDENMNFTARLNKDYFQMQDEDNEWQKEFLGKKLDNENLLQYLQNLAKVQSEREPAEREIKVTLYKTKETVYSSDSRPAFDRYPAVTNFPVLIPAVYEADPANPDDYKKLEIEEIEKRFSLEVAKDEEEKPIELYVETYEDHGRMFYLDQDMTLVITREGEVRATYFGILQEHQVEHFKKGDRLVYGTAIEFKGVGAPECYGTWIEYKIDDEGSYMEKERLSHKIRRKLKNTVEHAKQTRETPRFFWRRLRTFDKKTGAEQRYRINYEGPSYEEYKTNKGEIGQSELFDNYLDEEINKIENYAILKEYMPRWVGEVGPGIFLGLRYQPMVPDEPGTVRCESEANALKIQKDFSYRGGTNNNFIIYVVPLDEYSGSANHAEAVRVRTGCLHRVNGLDYFGKRLQKELRSLRDTLDEFLFNAGRTFRSYLLNELIYHVQELRIAKDMCLLGAQADHGEVRKMKGREEGIVLCGKFFNNLLMRILREERGRKGMEVLTKFFMAFFNGDISAYADLMKEIREIQKRKESERLMSPEEGFINMLSLVTEEAGAIIYEQFEKGWPSDNIKKLDLAEKLLNQILAGENQVLVLTREGYIEYMTDLMFKKFEGATVSIMLDNDLYNSLRYMRINQLIEEISESPEYKYNADLQKKVTQLRLRIVKYNLKNGNIANADYVFGEMKDSNKEWAEEIDVDMQKLIKEIESYKLFRQAQEALAIGDIELAEGKLKEMKETSGSPELIEQLEGILLYVKFINLEESVATDNLESVHSSLANIEDEAGQRISEIQDEIERIKITLDQIFGLVDIEDRNVEDMELLIDEWLDVIYGNIISVESITWVKNIVKRAIDLQDLEFAQGKLYELEDSGLSKDFITFWERLLIDAIEKRDKKSAEKGMDIVENKIELLTLCEALNNLVMALNHAKHIQEEVRNLCEILQDTAGCKKLKELKNAFKTDPIDILEEKLDFLKRDGASPRLVNLIQRLIETASREITLGPKDIRERLQKDRNIPVVGTLEEYPDLVFIVASDIEKNKFDEEEARMWKLACKAGYKIVSVNGYKLIKIEGFAPFAYLDGIIVQQKTTAIREQFQFKSTVERRRIVRESLNKISERLENLGIKKRLRIHDDDIGFIKGEPVLTLHGGMSSHEALLFLNKVKRTDRKYLSKESRQAAYFGEGSQETINPQIKKIMQDETGKDFYCMFGTSDERRRGNLIEAEQYRDIIENAMENLNIENYDVVVLRGVNFSGHYGRTRRRIYIPIEILEIASQNPEIAKDLIEDFIEHEYLEAQGMNHYEVVEWLKEHRSHRGGINSKAQKLYRKYIIERMLKEIEGIKGTKKLKRELIRILKKVQSGKKVTLKNINPEKLLLSIERSKHFDLAPKIARLVDLILADSYAGNRGKVVLLIEKAILDALPEEAVSQVTDEYELKEYELEEKILRTMQKIAEAKGIEPRRVKSIFDLFRAGVDIFSLDATLDISKVDGNYYKLISTLEELLGMEKQTIIKAFSKTYLRTKIEQKIRGKEGGLKDKLLSLVERDGRVRDSISGKLKQTGILNLILNVVNEKEDSVIANVVNRVIAAKGLKRDINRAKKQSQRLEDWSNEKAIRNGTRLDRAASEMNLYLRLLKHKGRGDIKLYWDDLDERFIIEFEDGQQEEISGEMEKAILAELDFNVEIKIIKDKRVSDDINENRDIKYLSEFASVSEDMKYLVSEVQNNFETKEVLNRSVPVLLYYQADSYIDFDNINIELLEGEQWGITFSHEPGLMALFNQLEQIDKGKSLIKVALGVSGETKHGISKKELLEKIVEKAGYKGKVFVVDEISTADDMEVLLERDFVKEGEINRNNVVFILNKGFDNTEAQRAIKRGIKVFGLQPDSAFHASLLFGVMYARIDKMYQSPGELSEETRAVIRFLDLFGVSKEDIETILDQLAQGLYFVVKLIRIEDTLNNFRNRRLYIGIAA